MSDKETVLSLLQNLPAEATLDEIRQGIEKLAAARKTHSTSQIAELRTSAEAATILTQALADHQSRQHGSEN